MNHNPTTHRKTFLLHWSALFLLGISLIPTAPVKANAADLPRLARSPIPDGKLADGIDSIPDPVLLGGYQATGGSEGEFTLFSRSSFRGSVSGLGRYNGQLAGVAVSPDLRLLALTRDGALGVYGDEPETLANPDARWRMLALAWLDDGPVALTSDAGRLILARPNADFSWTQDEKPVAVDPLAHRAELIVARDGAHLIWSSRAPDLSRGALRHLMRRDGAWRELSPLPLGDVKAFSAFAETSGIRLVALAPHPLGLEEPRLVEWRWNGSQWQPGAAYHGSDAERLARVDDIAAIALSPSATAWLTTGPDGAVLSEVTAGVALLGVTRDHPITIRDETRLSPEPSRSVAWSDLATPALMLSFLLLLLLYCRRSRQLSLAMPGRPADLISRAAAVAVDWLLISVAVSAYHLAAGDLRIYNELMTFESLNEMFWLNLGALGLYSWILEGTYGMTPGKYLAGLRVRSALGGPPTFFQAFLRNLARAFDMFPVMFPGLVGAVAAVLNVRRQRIGDLLASTVVRRHSPLSNRKFILASASPRRRELLEALGLNFRTEPSEIDEDAIQGDSPEATAIMLSEAKARAAAERLTYAAEVVVAADTMVVLDGEVLGKPRDAAEAAGMLGRLSGRSHTVLTGVTLWDSATGQGVSDVEHTEVEFRQLSQREIDDYVASGDPMDKAGAYGIQTGFLVKQVRGSLSNVAGLPMEMLQGMLSLLDS